MVGLQTDVLSKVLHFVLSDLMLLATILSSSQVHEFLELSSNEEFSVSLKAVKLLKGISPTQTVVNSRNFGRL